MRTQRADVTAITITEVQALGVVIHNRDHKVQLDVRSIQCGIGFQEGCPFCEGRGNHACALAPPLQDRTGQTRCAAQPDTEVIGIPGLVGEDEIKVVLQVLPNAGQFMHHVDAMLGNVLRTPHA